MRLASFIAPDGRPAFGALSADGARLSNLATGEVPDLRTALGSWDSDELRRRVAQARHDIALADIRWLPPIPQPGKILCVGLNYAAHAGEAEREMPRHPSVFTRFADTLVGHGQPIHVPRCSTQLDYEAELAVVIGRGGRHLRQEEASAAIAGYACFAENSVRDYQKHTGQVTPGKNFHASGGWGPWLVTVDEVPDVNGLEVVSRLNGREMQRDSVAHLIYSIAQIVAYVSEFTPLAPGDLIATGTPAGVGSLRKPPVFMTAGDVLEVEVTSLGTLRLPVIAEPA
ncbi:Ureidoglycolate lyase [Variovorax sp. PBS-H4]|uniref:fumarylacetoacetate hydrolase family protein n=1 Tax=Variovorax sp. PBS-H4 TaxID=434008 RepID=UPI001315B91E|nr:fumarylacetoacetate hydrolase family protein [Variovorax sp. PBS-H4]VTU22938.1 Ureidoglycolate lyase [Variovorax sp. PBS-H4]